MLDDPKRQLEIAGQAADKAVKYIFEQAPPHNSATVIVICAQIMMAFIERIAESPVDVMCSASDLRTTLGDMANARGDAKNEEL